jgi:hypothetical protein
MLPSAAAMAATAIDLIALIIGSLDWLLLFLGTA